MDRHNLLLLLAGMLLCCKNAGVGNTDKWSDEEEDGTEVRQRGYETHTLYRDGGICFYIEDSIAVIAPHVTTDAGITSIDAGFYSGDVSVPSVVHKDGTAYPVGKIGEYAFGSSYRLNSLTIAEGVTEIEPEAFRASSMKTITLPASVTVISRSAFEICRKLEEVNISPDNPEYVSSEGCASIAEKSSGRLLKAFRKIPASVSSIASGAIRGSGITELRIPAGVTQIEPGAFSGCSIEHIEIDPANTVFDTTPGLNCVIEKSTGRLIAGAGGMTAIPEDVREICSEAFFGVELGDSIILNDRLETIGPRAFYGHNFKSVRIPAHVKKISDNAFAIEEYSSLESVSVDPANRRFKSPAGSNVIIRKSDGTLLLGCSTSVIPDGVKSIGFGAFQGCEIETVRLPEGLVSVGDSAFLDCYKLHDLYLPESLKSLGTSAFQRCRALYDVTLPAGLEELGSHSFCVTSVSSIEIPQGLRVIDGFSFGFTKLERITIPEGVRKIGEGAFYSTPLKSATLPQSLEIIADEAFSNCRELSDVEIPQSVRYIGEYAFSYVPISRVSFGDALEVIGKSAFADCDEIRYVRIPAGVKKIGECAFAGCQLDSVSVDAGNEWYYSDSCNVIVERSSGKLLAGSAAASIPVGVKSIASRAFFTVDIHEIRIPEGVTEIGGSAFWGCRNASVIQLPSTLVSIGSVAFCYCSSARSINLPDGIDIIPQSAFLGCTSLESIVIPEGVTAIESYAFEGCTAMKSISLPSSLKSIGVKAFKDCWQLKDIRNASDIAIAPVEMPKPTFGYDRSMASIALESLEFIEL